MQYMSSFINIFNIKLDKSYGEVVYLSFRYLVQ
jgi:hypothetical protein